MKRVAILGAPGTGKTTLARSLTTQLNLSVGLSEYVPEYAASYIRKYGQPEALWEQLRILNKQLGWENNVPAANKYLITDSPVFLGYIYGSFLLEPNSLRSRILYADLSKMVIKELARYDYILYLSPRIDPVLDGTRTQDKEAQLEVDSRIRMFVSIHNLQSSTVYRTIDCVDLDRRVHACMEAIQSNQ
jgi:nicotinamide riboside kinase